MTTFPLMRVAHYALLAAALKGRVRPRGSGHRIGPPDRGPLRYRSILTLVRQRQSNRNGRAMPRPGFDIDRATLDGDQRSSRANLCLACGLVAVRTIINHTNK